MLYRFWYIKLYALTETKDFEGLEAFAKSKRSPIGYEPFINHLVKTGHLKQAASYVPRCDAKARADLYVRCGEWRLAALECKERNDRAKLECVRTEVLFRYLKTDPRSLTLQGTSKNVYQYLRPERTRAGSCDHELRGGKHQRILSLSLWRL